jgi:hypothetical protein
MLGCDIMLVTQGWVTVLNEVALNLGAQKLIIELKALQNER